MDRGKYKLGQRPRRSFFGAGSGVQNHGSAVIDCPARQSSEARCGDLPFPGGPYPAKFYFALWMQSVTLAHIRSRGYRDLLIYRGAVKRSYATA